MDLKKMKEQNKSAQETKTKSIKDLKKVPEKEAPPEVKSFTERIKTFNIEYQHELKMLNANVQSKVMDSDARNTFERVLSNLSAGINFQNLPPEIKNRHYCLARIICQLVEPPEWLLQAAAEDMGFCYELGGLLVDHENRFFLHDNPEDPSLQAKPRFRISE